MTGFEVQMANAQGSVVLFATTAIPVIAAVSIAWLAVQKVHSIIQAW